MDGKTRQRWHLGNQVGLTEPRRKLASEKIDRGSSSSDLQTPSPRIFPSRSLVQRIVSVTKGSIRLL